MCTFCISSDDDQSREMIVPIYTYLNALGSVASKSHCLFSVRQWDLIRVLSMGWYTWKCGIPSSLQKCPRCYYISCDTLLHRQNWTPWLSTVDKAPFLSAEFSASWSFPITPPRITSTLMMCKTLSRISNTTKSLPSQLSHLTVPSPSRCCTADHYHGISEHSLDSQMVSSDPPTPWCFTPMMPLL